MGDHLFNPLSTLRAGTVVLFLALLGASGPSAAGPERVVSMNVCTDQLVMLVADHEHIVSVSHLAVDPESSVMVDEARQFKINHGMAEEILPMEPDLVFAGRFTTRPTVALLRKLGHEVIEMPIAEDLEGIRANIRRVAQALGEERRGEKLIASFDRKLKRSRTGRDSSGPDPLAALYWANGYTSGSDTLANTVIEAAGFDTLGNKLGLTGTVLLPLESLLMANPDVLIIGQRGQGAALANGVFRHPALEQAFSTKRRISVPDHLWTCGTPFVADAIQHLARLRETMVFSH